MSCIDPVGNYDEFCEYEDWFKKADTNLHNGRYDKSVCVQQHTETALLNKKVIQAALTTIETVNDLARKIPLMKVDATVEIGGRIDWGGRHGVEVGGYTKVEVNDHKGNKASLEIEQKSDGKGSATISTSHGDSKSR